MPVWAVRFNFAWMRAALEIRNGFQRLVDKTDFAVEASSWGLQIDATSSPVFVAYFVTQADLTKIAAIKSARQ